MEPLPRKIKYSIVLNYLFKEVLSSLAFRRFLNPDTNKKSKEKQFMYDLVFGFRPRKFEADDQADRVIYDEEDEVLEMYFIQEGIIEVGFSLIYIQRDK